MHLSRTRKSRSLRLSVWLGLLALVAGGCDNTGQPGGGGLIRNSQSGREEWTIRCTRIETPDHRQSAKFLADLLKQVAGLKPQNVRVVSDTTGSTIYYGQYAKVASPEGSLVFPEQYQRDVELIRSLAYRQQTPFFYAGPEMLQAAEPATATLAEGEATTAKCTHSLLIAIFYNTPTFNQRKETAEAYVKELRKEGYSAYYYHEPLRSLVYVGDFDKSDLVQTRSGQAVYGPRVEQFIARNPEEFKYQTENGHIIKRSLNGVMVAPTSVLMLLPGHSIAPEAAPEPRPAMPGAGG